MESLCKKLNTLIQNKKDGFINEVNTLIEELYDNGCAMYWDRKIFIDCNFNEKKMRDLVKSSDLVQFEPSDDPEEHPGVVIRYKRK